MATTIARDASRSSSVHGYSLTVREDQGEYRTIRRAAVRWRDRAAGTGSAHDEPPLPGSRAERREHPLPPVRSADTDGSGSVARTSRPPRQHCTTSVRRIRCAYSLAFSFEAGGGTHTQRGGGVNVT